MEMSGSLLIAAALFASVFGIVLFRLLFEKVSDERRLQTMTDRAGGSGFAARIIGRGVAPLKGVAGTLMRLPAFTLLVEDMVSALRGLGYRTDAGSLSSLVVLLVAASTVLAYLVSFSLVGALAVGACSLLGLRAWASKAKEQRKEEMREEIPEALQSMKACFQTGYSLPQTVHEVAVSTKGPLSGLFQQVEGVLETGGGVHRALGILKNEGSESELVFLATALEIQHKAGGSMHRILEAARQSVIDEIELKRSLRTQTAQAKLSAQIVTVMPFALIGFFSLLSPGFLDPFFESPVGVLLLMVAFIMQGAGILLVRRLLKVEVA